MISHDVVEGSTPVSIARCFAPNARPKSKISWRSSRLGNLEHLTSDDESVLSIIPSRFMHRAQVECLIEHEGLEGLIVKEIILNVQYAPELPIMRIDDPNCNHLAEVRLICEDSRFTSNPP